MNIPINDWSVVSVLNSSIQELEHMTVSSFPWQSSMDYPITSMPDDGMQSEAAERLYSTDGMWTSAGPYDDDGESDEDEGLW